MHSSGDNTEMLQMLFTLPFDKPDLLAKRTKAFPLQLVNTSLSFILFHEWAADYEVRLQIFKACVWNSFR